MITDKDCGPNKVLINGMCVPATPEEKLEARQPGPASQADVSYYKQYLNNLPQYQTPGQGTYTGPGTAGFHPFYGKPGKTQSASVLSTPYIEGAPGLAGGHTGYDFFGARGGGGHGTQMIPRVTSESSRTPLGMPARFSMPLGKGEVPKLLNPPHSIWSRSTESPSIVNVGDLSREPETLIYSGPQSESQGRISLGDMLNQPFIGGGVPIGGAPAAPPAGGTPANGGLLNVGGLLGGAPAAGGGGSARGVPGAAGSSRGKSSSGKSSRGKSSRGKSSRGKSSRGGSSGGKSSGGGLSGGRLPAGSGAGGSGGK